MKDKYIQAYCYLFGATKKEAIKSYKVADMEYIKEIIKAFDSNSKKAFYND